nr:serine hydrolase domain-containing protein [Asanoa ferruginea]
MSLQDDLDRRADLHDVPSIVVGVSRAGARSVATRGARDDACFRIASLTKTFTAAALGMTLIERSIPLHTPAIDLLPAFAPDWHADRGITVEQILGQVSGLRESVNASAIADLGNGTFAIDEAAGLVVRAGNERPAGTRWSYYNGNYVLAGAILAAVTKVSYETALLKTVLTPWALDGTGFHPPRGPVAGRDGATELPSADYPRGRRPSGGLWSGVPDLLTFGERLLANGALLAETRRPRTAPEDPMAYGAGWALGPSGQLFVNGRLPGYRAAMLMVPDHDFVAVVLTNQEQALPAAARLLSDLQRPLTGDELAATIDRFAA